MTNKEVIKRWLGCRRTIIRNKQPIRSNPKRKYPSVSIRRKRIVMPTSNRIYNYGSGKRMIEYGNGYCTGSCLSIFSHFKNV